MMRAFLTGVAALALSGASAGCTTMGAHTAEPAAIVTQSVPETMASLDPADSILFWSAERRSAAFREMEALFPGLEAAQTGPVRELPRGTPLDAETGERWYKMWKAYQDDVIFAHATDDLSESQPTKGNILGGLSTIEEKAFGNLQKIGKLATFIDVLQPAQAPTGGSGLYFMDTSSAAAECVTLQAASGAIVHLFPTGQGNVIGNPIVPVVKITANPRTVRTMSEHVDVDVSGILRRDMTIDQAGDALIENIMRTANGRFTAAEALVRARYALPRN